MADIFKGVVWLTDEQYKELKDNGEITIDGVTHVYDSKILYVTPRAEAPYLKKGDISLTLKDNGAYTLTINKE